MMPPANRIHNLAMAHTAITIVDSRGADRQLRTGTSEFGHSPVPIPLIPGYKDDTMVLSLYTGLASLLKTGSRGLELKFSSMFSVSAGAALLVVLLAAAGCTYRPGADNPVARSMQWFSYAGAGDIRKACETGGPDRMRLIYNGKYDEQLRSYDVVARSADAAFDGGTIEVRIRGPKDVTKAFYLFDLFAPWRAEGRLIRLNRTQLAELRQALEDSGLARPVPDGIRLNSLEFYWLVSACLGGKFTMNAWKYPSKRFEALVFPTILLRLDPEGPDLNPPRPYNEFPTEGDTDRFIDFGFNFRVKDNTLIGG